MTYYYYYSSKPSVFSHLLDYPTYTSIYDYPRTSYSFKYTYSSTPSKIYDYYNWDSYYWAKYYYAKAEREWDAHVKRLDKLNRPNLEYRGTSLPPITSRTYYPLSTYRARSVTPGLVDSTDKYSRFRYSSLRRRRDPWYWEYPSYRSPYFWSTYYTYPYWRYPDYYYRYPYYTRPSYTSPISRSYTWSSSYYPYTSYYTSSYTYWI